MSNVVAFDPARRRRQNPSETVSRSPRRRPDIAARPPAGTPLDVLAGSWRRALEEADKSPYTVKNYTQTVRYLTAWLAENGHPTDSEGVQAEHLRAWLHAERQRTSPASAAARHQHLTTFWKWAVDENERSTPSPMTNVDKIKVPPKVRTFFTDKQKRDLLDTCKGASFIDIRDTALFRIFYDTGVRVGGMANIRYTPDNPETNDIDLDERRLRIRLKGGAEHWIPLGRKAIAALDRYIRARAKHPYAEGSDWLWLGTAGKDQEHFTDSGIRRMFRIRGRRAGVEGAHPHRCRRSFAHDYLDGGGDTDGLMAITGWKSSRMPQLYAGELAADRARKAHRRLSPGDRI